VIQYIEYINQDGCVSTVLYAPADEAEACLQAGDIAYRVKQDGVPAQVGDELPWLELVGILTNRLDSFKSVVAFDEALFSEIDQMSAILESASAEKDDVLFGVSVGLIVRLMNAHPQGD
jgi:hypothetical protein